MRLLKYAAAYIVLTLSGLCWTGCQTHKAVIPLNSGYQEVSHPHHTFIDEPEPPRISFQHRAADGTVTQIWPSLFGVDTVIEGDLAIFVAEKAYVDPERVTHPRLFAVQAPALPLDLTDEILWRWSQANGKNFNKTLQKFSGITPVERNGGLEVRLDFWADTTFGTAREDWPDNSSILFTWPQVEEIIQAVKAKGVVQKDLRWHTEYIGEKY